MAQKSISIFLGEHGPFDISHAAVSPVFSFPSAAILVIGASICQPARGIFISPVTQDYVEAPK